MEAVAAYKKAAELDPADTDCWKVCVPVVAAVGSMGAFPLPTRCLLLPAGFGGRVQEDR